MNYFKKICGLILCFTLVFGLVQPTALASEDEIIVDNTDAGFSVNGNWNTSTTLSGYYGANYRADATSGADSADTWAKWELPIEVSGFYDVYIRWTADTNRPDAAPIEIQYFGGTDDTKTVNQTQNSGQWVLIGRYQFTEGTDNYVKLLATDSGYTIADAVKLVEAPAQDIIIDNIDAGFSVNGSWNTSTTISGYYGANYHADATSVADSADTWAKWELPNEVSGFYDVYMRWTADTNRPDASPIEVHYFGGTDDTKTVDQTQNNDQWVLIGRYQFAEGADNYVKLLASDSGYTIADAVKLVEAPAQDIIIDNTDAGFSVNGSWNTSTTISGYYGENYRADITSVADSSDTWAKWSANVTGSGRYDAYMRWTADTNRPKNAPLEYTFGDQSGTIYLNQKYNNGIWVHLGTFDLVAGAENSFKLYATSSGCTIADAVRFVPTEGFFEDVGIISSGSHHLPSIIAVDSNTLTIVAQNRYPSTVPGGHFEKGPADIIAFTSTDKGSSWSQGSYIFDKDEAEDDNVCAYSSVLVMNDDTLMCIYDVGPENWNTTQLTVYQATSQDAGLTWTTPTTPTIISGHSNGLPTNGGKGYKHTNGRLIIPGRKCLLYSDDNGATWTATEEFAGHVETKVAPCYISGNMSLTAIVPWRTENTSEGKNSRIRIADYYSNNATYTTSYGSSNNFGFCRYDNSTLLMTVARSNKLYIRTSYDEGITWSNEKLVSGSAPSARYSDIAVLDDGTIVVTFIENESDASTGAKLRVVKFDMDWLLS